MWVLGSGPPASASERPVSSMADQPCTGRWRLQRCLSHRFGMMGAMEPLASVRFSWAARLLAAEARRLGLTAPGFRCPPRDAAAVRAIRRYPGGQAVVAVRVRGRPFAELVDDMVDGGLVGNGIVRASAQGAA